MFNKLTFELLVLVVVLLGVLFWVVARGVGAERTREPKSILVIPAPEPVFEQIGKPTGSRFI